MSVGNTELRGSSVGDETDMFPGANEKTGKKLHVSL